MPATLARHIDQTLLKPTVGLGQARTWIEEYAEPGFATLCVSPFLVPLTTQHPGRDRDDGVLGLRVSPRLLEYGDQGRGSGTACRSRVP